MQAPIRRTKTVALLVLMLLACSPALPLIGRAAEQSDEQAGGDLEQIAESTEEPAPLEPDATETPDINFLLPTPQAVIVEPGALNPNPPTKPLKLIFIHHSTGENWLRDDNGNLGRTLEQNRYFVSDTNYGWGPDAIGDRTDIPDWLEWFRGPQSASYVSALYQESGQNAEYSRRLADPGGQNSIVLIKSCFPNSNLEGSPNDAAARGEGLSVANARYVYNELLAYFGSRPDKLFVVITAPPVSDGQFANNARAFNLWLAQRWLAENRYALHNVTVFDFYNILTGRDNHHRYREGAIEYVIDRGHNTAFYPSARDDDHPSAAGNQKATTEFVPFLNVAVHCWQGDGGCPR